MMPDRQVELIQANLSNPSVVDYLNRTGRDSSFSARSSLYSRYGGVSIYGAYQGTANQNLWLLDRIKKDDVNGTPVKLSSPAEILKYDPGVMEPAGSTPYIPINQTKTAAPASYAFTMPGFSAKDPLERLSMLLALWESESKSTAYLAASEAQQKETQVKFIDKTNEIFVSFLQAYPEEKLAAMRSVLLVGGDIEGAKRLQTLIYRRREFLRNYAEWGKRPYPWADAGLSGLGSAAGVAVQVLKAGLAIVRTQWKGFLLGMGLAVGTMVIYDWVKPQTVIAKDYIQQCRELEKKAENLESDYKSVSVERDSLVEMQPKKRVHSSLDYLN